MSGRNPDSKTSTFMVFQLDHALSHAYIKDLGLSTSKTDLNKPLFKKKNKVSNVKYSSIEHETYIRHDVIFLNIGNSNL